jgi:hypothetical protein
MKVRVIKAFPYAADGFHNVVLPAGEDAEVHDYVVPSLINDGLIAVDTPVLERIAAELPGKDPEDFADEILTEATFTGQAPDGQALPADPPAGDLNDPQAEPIKAAETTTDPVPAA